MASLTNAQRDHLVTLFVGMFDAAPGANYLGALVEIREAGYSLPQIAEILAAKPQFKELYPATMSAEDAADRIIATLLTDATSDATKEWAKDWLLERLTGDDAQSLGSVLFQALEALTLTENANYASAQAQLANKLEVANYYSVNLLESSTSLEELQAVLAEVTDDPDSVDAAKDALDNPGEGPGPGTPPPGEEEDDDVLTPPAVSGTSQSLSESIAAGTVATDVDTTADKVTLTLKITQTGGDANDGTETYTAVTLTSDAKQLSITLTPATDTNETSTTADDGLDKVSLSISANGTDYADLVSLTLGGNGKAEITNDDGASLVYIDASSLASKTADGDPDEALILTSSNSLAEGIKLGSGNDVLTLNASTYDAMDVVTGLKLVDDGDTTGTQLDVAVSDDINVGVTGFVQLEPEATKLGFALIEAAASGDEAIVFQFGGNTYIYADTGATAGSLDDDDFVVKLVGTVNLDLLVEALNS